MRKVHINSGPKTPRPPSDFSTPRRLVSPPPRRIPQAGTARPISNPNPLTRTVLPRQKDAGPEFPAHPRAALFDIVSTLEFGTQSCQVFLSFAEDRVSPVLSRQLFRRRAAIKEAGHELL